MKSMGLGIVVALGMICISNHYATECCATEQPINKELNENDRLECRKLADYLFKYFTIDKEDVRKEFRDDGCQTGPSTRTLGRIFDLPKYERKRKILEFTRVGGSIKGTFDDLLKGKKKKNDIIEANLPDKISEEEDVILDASIPDAISQEYIRVHTEGKGLCYFYALGYKPDEDVFTKDLAMRYARAYQRTVILQGIINLFDNIPFRPYVKYSSKQIIEKMESSLSLAPKEEKEIILWKEIQAIIEESREVVKTELYGSNSRQGSQFYRVEKLLEALSQKLEDLEENTPYNDWSSKKINDEEISGKEISDLRNCMLSVAKKCRNMDDPLESTSFEGAKGGLMPMVTTFIPAYIHFSRERKEKVAVYYNRDDLSGNFYPLPARKWVVFDGGDTKFEAPTSGLPTQSQYKELHDKLEKLQNGLELLSGEDFKKKLDEPSIIRMRGFDTLPLDVFHHIVLEKNGDVEHACRLIPLKYYDKIKQIFEEEHPEVLIMESVEIRDSKGASLRLELKDNDEEPIEV